MSGRLRVSMPERRLKFMVIGAQKAGTTWLHANLSDHPQIAFPPIKELFYFNEIDAGIPTSLWGRKWNNHWLNIKWKKIIKEQLPQAAWRLNVSETKWFLRYLMIPRNLKKSSLDQYDRLFPNLPGTISGDITPNYSLLSEPTVAAIANYYPDCKIIFIMRNPVERSWSQAKMNLGLLKNRDFRKVSTDEIKQYLSLNPSNEQLSDYQATIYRWSAYFPKAQLHFTFYDALRQDPVMFYRNMLAFLELKNTFDEEKLKKVIYKGVKMDIPARFEYLLSVKYHDQIQFLADYFRDYPVNYPQQWLTRVREVISQVRVFDP